MKKILTIISFIIAISINGMAQEFTPDKEKLIDVYALEDEVAIEDLGSLETLPNATLRTAYIFKDSVVFTNINNEVSFKFAYKQTYKKNDMLTLYIMSNDSFIAVDYKRDHVVIMDTNDTYIQIGIDYAKTSKINEKIFGK